MAGFGSRQSLAVLSTVILAGLALPVAADAHSHHHARHARHAREHHHAFASSGGRVIQCVAFARADTGIDLSGNAANWWSNAAGRYARGNAPEEGSVLNFRANARMRLGHVAVVSQVVNSRLVRIDQSHWNRNGVSRDISVIDVSPDNDWSAVRVALDRGDRFGAIYPTFGFIYPRADNGVVVAARSDAPLLDAGPATRLRALGRRHAITLEVAEAPDTGRGVSLSTPGLVADAPDRELR